MKTIKTLLLAVLCIGVLQACSKDKENGKDPEEDGKTDDKNVLVKEIKTSWKHMWDGTVSVCPAPCTNPPHIYGDKDVIATYTYEGNKITRIDRNVTWSNFSNGKPKTESASIQTFRYMEDLITYSKISNLYDVHEFRFKYDLEKRLEELVYNYTHPSIKDSTKIKFVYSSDDKVELSITPERSDQSIELSLNNNSIISFSSSGYNDKRSYSMKYDTKKTPFRNITGFSQYQLGTHIYSMLSAPFAVFYDAPLWMSHTGYNNLIEEEHANVNPTQNKGYIKEILFLYNNKDYPIGVTEITTTSGGLYANPIAESTIEYYE